MEPDSFGRVKRSFSVVEKALVFMVGLPVFDHSAVPPCNKAVLEYFLITRAHLLTLLLVNKCAAQSRGKVNSFLKNNINCFSQLGGKKKSNYKKEAGIRAF